MLKKKAASPSSKSKSASKTAAPDAIALLKKDHETVRGLLSDLESAKDARKREKLIQEIEHEVRIHATIEEEIFYPAFLEAVKKSDDRKLFFEAREEHHVVDMVLPEVAETDPSSEEFAAKAKVLKELIEHHADEEEDEMFPRARKLFDKERLQELGAQMAERKEELQSEM